jgi:hypothetical protein
MAKSGWSGDGHERGVFGIQAAERLVATKKFDRPWYPGEAVGAIDLVERDDVTELTQTLRYQSPKARETVLATPIEHGMALGRTGWRRSWSHVRNARGQEGRGE